MSRLPRVCQLILFYALLAWLGSMLLIATLAALPLLLVPASIRQPVVQLGIGSICRIFLAGSSACGLMRLDLAALDSLKYRQKLLLTPNHPSLIDAFLILSRIPHAICLMKASISMNLFLGIGARLAGYVSNRHPDQMFRSAISVVQQGGLLLVFPEGTRTTRQPVNPLQGAAALIAKHAHAPLQAILLTTNSAYLSKGWPLLRPPAFPLIYRACLGPLIEPATAVTSTTDGMQQVFERGMSQSIDPDLSI